MQEIVRSRLALVASPQRPVVPLVVLAVLAACAIPEQTRRVPLPGDPVLPPASDPAGPQSVGSTAPLGEAVLGRLRARMDRAHATLGRARPAVTGLVTGDLGTGQTQGFTAELERGSCYTVIVTCATDDQRVDLSLYDESGTEVEQRLAGDHATAVDVCPAVRGRYRVVVRMYAGSGLFVLQVFGS